MRRSFVVVPVICLGLLPSLAEEQDRFVWGKPDIRDSSGPNSVMLLLCVEEPCFAKVEVHNGLVFSSAHISVRLRNDAIVVQLDYVAGDGDRLDMATVTPPADYYVMPLHLYLPENADGIIRIFKVPLS